MGNHILAHTIIHSRRRNLPFRSITNAHKDRSTSKNIFPALVQAMFEKILGLSETSRECRVQTIHSWTDCSRMVPRVFILDIARRQPRVIFLVIYLAPYVSVVARNDILAYCTLPIKRYELLGTLRTIETARTLKP